MPLDVLIAGAGPVGLTMAAKLPSVYPKLLDPTIHEPFHENTSGSSAPTATSPSKQI